MMDKIELTEEKLPNIEDIEMPEMKRSQALGIQDSPREVKEVLKEKLREKIEAKNETEEEKEPIIEEIVPPFNLSKRASRVQILQQIYDLNEKMGRPRPTGISKFRKDDLKKILANLMEEAVHKIQNPPIKEDVGDEKISDALPEKVYNTPNMKEQMIASALVRFTYMVQDVAEKITKAHKPGGFVLDGWRACFTNDQRMEDELKQCMVEIYRENQEFLEPMLTATSRLFLLLGSTAVMSLKNVKNISYNIDRCHGQRRQQLYYPSRNTKNLSTKETDSNTKETHISEQ